MFGLYLPVANAIGPAFGLWVAEEGSFQTLFNIAGAIGIVSVVLMFLIRQPRTSSQEAGKKRVDAGEEQETISADRLPKSFIGFEFGVVYPSLTLMLVYFGYSAIISFVALYAISSGVSGIGLFFTIGAIALFVARLFFAKLVKRYGYHRFVIVSIILFAAVLFLIPHIENMLRERKILEEHYSKLLGKDFDREYDGFVCRDNFGKLITPNFVTDHFKRVISRNKLKKLRFHDLRHSCASLLLAKGASMKAIQDWLGHSTFNVTANFYSHLDYKSRISSAEVISNALGDEEDENEGEKKNAGSN